MSKITLKPIDPSFVPTPPAGTQTMFIDVNDGETKYKLDDNSIIPIAGVIQGLFKTTKLFSNFTGVGYIAELVVGQLPKKSVIQVSMIRMLNEWILNPSSGISTVRCQLVVRDSTSDFTIDTQSNLVKDVVLCETTFGGIAGNNIGASQSGIVGNIVLNRTNPVDVVLKIGVDAASIYPPVQIGGSLQITDYVTVADVAGSLNSTYFLYSDSFGDYYIWYDNGTGVDPSIVGRTGVQVVYANNDSAETIAYKTAKILFGFGSFFVYQSADKLRIIDNNGFEPLNATVGTTGFSLTVKNYGGNPLPVVAINPTLSSFVINGDHTTRFQAGFTFDVVGSTANDGRYTISSSYFDGVNTNINVTTAIPSSTADGVITTIKNITDLAAGSLEAFIKYSTFE